MSKCPKSIDGAVVILAVTLDPVRHRYTGSTRLYADGVEQTWFAGLAIARYGRDSNDGDVYLFYCDEEWGTLNDTCYGTIEEVMTEAACQFGVTRDAWGPVAWPFDQTRRTACMSTKPVFHANHPILFVQHFSDDHSWVFSCGTTFESGDILLVGMETVFRLDPSIAVISDLAPGWSAVRSSLASPWMRRPSAE